jgi:ABC-2 type transport system permease protein
MKLLSVFRKCAREQKRDLWVVGLSLAFAPLFVLIYWMMTGATGSTAYSVLVINHDQKVSLANGAVFSAGVELEERLRGVTYQNGAPILKIVEATDRPDAETRLRNREATALIIIPTDFSRKLADFRNGNVSAATNLTFVGDLTNPYYTVAAVMAMTAADSYTQEFTSAPRPVALVEIPLGASSARTEFENYVPGLLVLATVLMIFQAAMTPARDIESGVMRRLRLTGLSAFDYLGGTTLWMALIAVASVLMTFASAVACGFRSQGNLWVAIVVGVLNSLSIIGLGLIVACFSKTVSHAFVIANFPLGFLMFLSGAAFPLPRTNLFTLFGHGFALPDLLPPTHAVVALNKVFTLGASLGDVAFELSALTVLTLLYFGIGVWVFSKTQMKAS